MSAGAHGDLGGQERAAALRQLTAVDLLAVDDGGRLIAAYPFSPVPTPHAVSLGDVDVFAMCAIDALGMPFMLDTDAVITSADPHTGKPIQVTVQRGTTTYQPPEAVVVYGASRKTGRSVDTCCSTINFARPTRSWSGPGRIGGRATGAGEMGLGVLFSPLAPPYSS